MLIDVDTHGAFVLDQGFLRPYRSREVPWGHGDLSAIVYQRTYSRDGERWWQTCQRVIEGMMTVQRFHCRARGLPFDETHAHDRAQNAYARMFELKWTPPGRGLWIMGTRFMYERGGAALNNCGFVSTADIANDYAGPFVWMMRMAMLGVGVGFDTQGKGSISLQSPVRAQDVHVIADSREGWAEALQRLLLAYVGKASLPMRWDDSQIRPAGSPLVSFGGFASGPEPLRVLLHDLQRLQDDYVDRKLDAQFLVDAMNLIGRCVVAGGIRRTAQIALGDANDLQFQQLKNDAEKLHAYRWVSNNSVVAQVGMDYESLAKQTAIHGEPGYFWLEQARAYGRMADAADHVDDPACGTNPCGEQTLWDRELCCLVETYPARHDSLDDFKKTLRVAYEYAKTVTLVPIEDPHARVVIERNRRIGCSMTGIVQAMHKHGYRRFLQFCDAAYPQLRGWDRNQSKRWGVPTSIKLTSVKPSGTVSILAGATPGVHWEHAPYFIRRIRVSNNHPVVEMCRQAGYEMEPDAYAPATMVVSFPVHMPLLDRGKAQVSLWEKVDLASQLQRHWSDNQVSCTADFDPEREVNDLSHVLRAYEGRLKAVSFLPRDAHGYEQPPYETIDETRYKKMVAGLRPLVGELAHEHEAEERFCSSAVCDLKLVRHANPRLP